MTPYLLLLSIPAFLSMSYRKQDIGIELFIVFLIYVVFVGCRDEVGPDWYTYAYTHDSLRGQDIKEIALHSEPLSFLLFWISENYDFEMTLTNICAAAIMLFGICSFSRLTVNPWLAIVAATPYLIIAFGMSGIRQGMGVGVILFVFSKWNKLSLIHRISGIVVASMFHSSAVICIIFIVYSWPHVKPKTQILIRIVSIPVIGLLIYYINQSGGGELLNYGVYQKRYLEDPDAVVSSGSIMHISLIAFPAILGYIFKARIKYYIFNYELLKLGIIGGLVLFPLNIISTTVASRLSLYFYFVPMLVYPALSIAFGKSYRFSLTLLIVMAHFLILATWLLYANNSYRHIPYKTILF